MKLFSFLDQVAIVHDCEMIKIFVSYLRECVPDSFSVTRHFGLDVFEAKFLQKSKDTKEYRAKRRVFLAANNSETNVINY